MTAVYILLAIIIAMGFILITVEVWNNFGIDALEDLIRELRTKENAKRFHDREVHYVSSVEELRRDINRGSKEGYGVSGFDLYLISMTKTEWCGITKRYFIVPNDDALKSDREFRELWWAINATVLQSVGSVVDTINYHGKEGINHAC